MAADSADRRDFVVKIDGEDERNNGGAGDSVGRIWRDGSCDFWTDGHDNPRNAPNTAVDGGRDAAEQDEGFDFRRGGNGGAEDPPTKLIGQFLQKQKASGEVSLDMDLGRVELQPRGLTPVSESPASATANNNSAAVKRRDSNGSAANEDGEVVKCSSNASFQRSSSNLLKTRTRSRLLDPPTPPLPPQHPGEMKSGRVPRSGQLKSGFFGKTPKTPGKEEEEEDPFSDEDVPEEYKRDNLSFWILLEWVSLILIIAALVCSLVFPFLRGKKLWKLELWKWELMVLVLICGRLVSSWIVRIVVFFVERNFLLRKRVLYFVYGIRKAVQNCLWLGLALTAWHFLFDKKVARETNSKVKYVTKVLICLLVGFALWLVKTLLVKVLASSFHMSTYFDRIQESLFTQYVIEALSGPPLIELQKNEEAEEEERIADEAKKLVNPSGGNTPSGTGKSPRTGKSPLVSRLLSTEGDSKGITIDSLHKMNPKNVSAWRMKRLMNMIRHGALTTLDEQIQDSNLEDDKGNQIRSELEAKLAARKIFHNVAKPGSKFIYMEDIMRFMPEDEAMKTLSLFEGASESNRISKSSLKNWVVNAFRERRALALTLNDTKTAVNRLHKMVNILVGIIIAVIWLLILGIATTRFLVVISSQVVLVAFIFGNMCKTVFESIIFLFVIHPFDVGDRCEIDGVQMVVEEMNILTTVFLRFDNQKIVYPNSLLWTKSIGNYYRSPDMGDGIEFTVHISTPADKIALMKQRITSYIEGKKDQWYGAPMIIFKDMEGLNSVRIAVWPTHRMNHQDMGERWSRRAQLVEEISKICREVDIDHRLYPLDVNIRHMPPLPVSDRLPPAWSAAPTSRS
ncbi:PREDICTED: mechanosensitive ion channel protein 6 [Tarenaya hassleriana]|uniref:mechanosensitive ion channel protein 6 n=1 Tax=Tarenaya hassleriana TaxID=28532 RepID=UPI00053C9B35|nr:PREDICTED: mechanosensitive ion channel protein 6 [Tarenaya hassleriana]